MNRNWMVQVEVLVATSGGHELTLALFHKFKACHQQGKEGRLFLWLVCRDLKLSCNCHPLSLLSLNSLADRAALLQWGHERSPYIQLYTGLCKRAPRGWSRTGDILKESRYSLQFFTTHVKKTPLTYCNGRFNSQWTTFHRLKKQGCGLLYITKSFQQAKAEGSSKFPVSAWRNQWFFFTFLSSQFTTVRFSTKSSHGI